MKALVLKEYKQFAFEDMPEPDIKPDEVLIRVKSCGICGSDVHGMDGSTGRRIPPLVMGHEAAGEIAKVGVGVKDWAVGDRVTFDSTVYPLDDWFTAKGLYNLSDERQVLGVSCEDYRRHGAFAEYVAVPQHILYRIPERVTFNQAAMVEPVGVVLHALSLTPLALNDTAVVVGTGMIGLFMVQVLCVAGCEKIIAVDMEDHKLDLARQLGATHALNAQRDNVPEAVRELTSGRGADVVFEAVGISPTVKTAVESVRKGGTVTLIGNLARSVELPLQAVVTRQIRLQGTCSICGEYPAALSLIERGAVNVDAILSATAPLADGAAWFKRLYDQEPGLMKVILNP